MDFVPWSPIALVVLAVLVGLGWWYISTAKRVHRLFSAALTDLNAHKEYLADTDYRRWRERNSAALDALATYSEKLGLVLSAAKRRQLETLHAQMSEIARGTIEFNMRFKERRLVEDSFRFDEVERYPLTQKQREAIVTDEDTTQVIAGAGTGKTSVIVGKVDYILRHKLAEQNEVLVMAYNRTAAEELRHRMSRLGVSKDMKVKTFHAFGREIIAEATGMLPSVHALATDNHLRHGLIRDTLKRIIESEGVENPVMPLFTDLLDEPSDPNNESISLKTKADQIAFDKARGLRCLAGNLLKSRQEVKIANWLTLNGINWTYEKPYKHKTATREHQQYKPDFYLSDFDIYVEHFGVDRDGSTAAWIDPEEYARQMEWKRDLHHHHKTTLVETYSYEDREGSLTGRLGEKLAVHGVNPRVLTDEELQAIVSSQNSEFSRFVRVVDQFLELYRGSTWEWPDVEKRADSHRDIAFLKLASVALGKYEQALQADDGIDFNDMITNARKAIQNGEYKLPYRYVIIDEFQDITHNRFELVRDILKQNEDGKLFVVGDDWQSIYRFAGADVSITTSLHSHVGPSVRIDLDQAFRQPQQLLTASTMFITKNPHQLVKNLSSTVEPDIPTPIHVISHDKDQEDSALQIAFQTIRAEKEPGRATTAYLISRYNHTQPKGLNQYKAMLAADGIELEAITAHMAKGLEADYVIVQDLNSGGYGFPSTISDDPVIDMVLVGTDHYEFAEERRLFYVAVTRARKRVFLCAASNQPSVFIEKDVLSKEMENVVKVFGAFGDRHKCPSCNGRTIYHRSSRNGKFWGCSNFPLCDGVLATCPKCNMGALTIADNGMKCHLCESAALICPKCNSGALIEKGSAYGPILACSNGGKGWGCPYVEYLR